MCVNTAKESEHKVLSDTQPSQLMKYLLIYSELWKSTNVGP
jgi:hypothetical protein